jgi:tetratricopeptide (TPR) repeat protein
MATAENILKGVGEISPLKAMGIPARLSDSRRKAENSDEQKKRGKLCGVLNHLFHREKKESADSLEYYLDQCQKNPKNAAFHLKLAAIYQREGEEEKAIAKYRQAAEIFSRDHFFPQAMAIYKQILSLNPHLVQVNQKMAEIYREMGLLAEAVSQYKIVGKHFARWGMKEKIPEVMKRVDELESLRTSGEKKLPSANESIKIAGARPETLCLSASKMTSLTLDDKGDGTREKKEEKGKDVFDLRAELETSASVEWKDIKEISTDKLSGFEEIFKELQETVIPREVYPNFNYHMGVACREMGFNDGAIEQLQIAFENNQKPLEAARLLSTCLREKGWFNEAQKFSEKAMRLEIDSKKGTLGFKSELVLIHT